MAACAVVGVCPGGKAGEARVTVAARLADGRGAALVADDATFLQLGGRHTFRSCAAQTFLCWSNAQLENTSN